MPHDRVDPGDTYGQNPGMAPTVLIVEDEVLLALPLEDALTEAGFNVMFVADGATALNLLRDSGSKVSLLLTDIRMPGSHNGWEVARVARELHPALPVIYMTGDSEALHQEHGVRGSILMKKPFTLGHAVRIVTKMLASATSETGDAR